MQYNFGSPGRHQYLSYPIPEGMGGIKHFQIPRMKEYILEFSGHPDIIEFTRTLVLGCPAKDLICEVETIHKWMCQHMRFVNDPVGKEVISTPLRLLNESRDKGRSSGDCDELSCLESTMIATIGMTPRLMFGGKGEELYHVWVQVEINGDWEDLEPSGYLPAGQSFEFPVYKYLEIF